MHKWNLLCVLIVTEKRDRIFISYASVDEQVANRIAECLKAIKEIWIDKEEIIWGDQIVAKINDGLSTSFVGIVILSNNFFKREMPQLELNTMLYLATNMQFRILPLYHGIDHHDVVRRYPLLSNIRGEKADLDCGILVSKLSSVIKKVKEIDIIPIIKRQTVSTSIILDGSAKEVSKNEMEEIYTELRKDTTKNRTQATITKLRSYSDKKRIWKHSVTWDIISYLLNSDTSAMDGLYVIEYMIKLSQKEYPDDLNPVIYNVRESFLPRLLKLIRPGVEKRLSGDSFGILRIIIEENTLSRYALEALNMAMNELNDPEYSDYIVKYVLHFDQASKKNQENLCNFMYDLTLRDDKVGTRAKVLYDYFIKKL